MTLEEELENMKARNKNNDVIFIFQRENGFMCIYANAFLNLKKSKQNKIYKNYTLTGSVI